MHTIFSDSQSVNVTGKHGYDPKKGVRRDQRTVFEHLAVHLGVGLHNGVRPAPELLDEGPSLAFGLASQSNLSSTFALGTQMLVLWTNPLTGCLL